MKRRIMLTALISGALVLTAAVPAQATSGTAPRGSIVDVAVAASGGGTPDNNGRDYDLLVQALLATGLAPVLADQSTKFTVFAPNDNAFRALVTDLTGSAPASEAAALTTITTALSTEQISNILLGHVVAGRSLGPVEVLVAGSIETANGSVIRPRGLKLRDANSAFTDATLLLSGINIKADNGVIHTISRVILPAVI